jgi:ABC-2 type transport system permease protein
LAKEPFLYYFQQDTTMQLKVKQPGAAAISYNDTSGFTIQPILDKGGNEQSWIENGVLVVDSAAPIFSEPEGDVRKSHYVTGIKMSRTIHNREQRIVVLGDADFMSDMRGIGGVLGNAAVSWALYNEYPKYASRPLPHDTLFGIGSKTAQTIFIVYLFIIPGLTLLLGTIILIRRNRK